MQQQRQQLQRINIVTNTIVTALRLVIIFLTGMAFAEQALGAGIAELTVGPFAVTRGDIVMIEAIAVEASSKIEWWIDGKRACDKSRCEIDTTGFSPGEYIYTVIVDDYDGIATAQISISATAAKPLYVPGKIHVLVTPKNSDVATINRGDWAIVPYSGAITYPNLKVAEKVSRFKTISPGKAGIVYSVGSGAQAIVRRIGHNDQWLVSSDSTFQFKNNLFELLSGRAQWRRVHRDPAKPLSAIIAGAKIQSTGGLLLRADIGPGADGVRRAIISQIEGQDVSLVCGNGIVDTVKSGTSKSFTVGKSGNCEKIDAEIFEITDPTALSTLWSPWWFKKSALSSVDRWRIESMLLDSLKSEAELLTIGTAALEEHYCADFLDLIGPSQNHEDGDVKIMHLFGNCQFSLGMYKISLKTFEKLEARDDTDAVTAFMIGRTYQMLLRHKEALEWFDEAERRKFIDRVELGRFAAKSALEIDDSKQRLRWLETMTQLEKNDGRARINLEISDDWRENRPRGARIGGRLYMDGQALPINSKVPSAVYTGANSSRSLVYGMDGDWWLSRKITEETSLKLSGAHAVTTPYDTTISFATKFMTNFSLAVEIGNHETMGAAPPDRWVFDVAGNFGTAITGGARQRDRFGWSLATTRPKWRNLTFGIISDKYLDPLPGGGDVLDIDMNRYTGDADHSHIDLIFYSGLSTQSSHFSWLLRAEYGTIDYRTGILDALDSTHTKALCDFSWLLSTFTRFAVSPSITSKTYKNAGGTDQTSSLQTGFRFRTAPLWTTLLDASLENRVVSKDKASSWMRHTYGFGLSADL